MKRILTTAALAAALSAGGGWLLTTPQTATPGLAMPGAASAQDSTESSAEVIDMALGEPDAPVEIIEYASFTCPHCAAFEENVFPRIKENYIDTGKVRFVHREAYFNKFDIWASMMARCGGEMKYFGIIDMIYGEQNDWARKGSEGEVADAIRKIGLRAGISKEALDVCMSDGDQLRAMVEWYQGNAEADGFNSTPSFMVDGELHTNMSYDDFAELIDERLAASQ